MVYPLRSGMTVSGPLGISSLGGVNFTSGAVAAAAGEAKGSPAPARFVLGGFLGIIAQNPHGLGRDFPEDGARHHAPVDGPPGVFHYDHNGQDRVVGRYQADEQGVKFAVGIGPADDFLAVPVCRPP